MRFGAFIEKNLDGIVAKRETFARTLLPAKTTSGLSYFPWKLVRFGAKSRCATSICKSPLHAPRRFAQLLDFIAHLDVHRVNLREKYDHPSFENVLLHSSH